MLTEWKHNESMVYEKNPNYWNADNVKIERIELMLSADDTAVYAAYQAGDLDFIDNMPTDQIASLNGIDPLWRAPGFSFVVHASSSSLICERAIC